jgi:hypothetical protein
VVKNRRTKRPKAALLNTNSGPWFTKPTAASGTQKRLKTLIYDGFHLRKPSMCKLYSTRPGLSSGSSRTNRRPSPPTHLLHRRRPRRGRLRTMGILEIIIIVIVILAVLGFFGRGRLRR